MNEYELTVYHEILKWKRKSLKKPSVMQRVTKQAQGKINGMIPEKAHEIITESIKQMVETTLTGSRLTTNSHSRFAGSLADKDNLALKKRSFYQKTATVEGAGTGAGGIFLGLADFPLLLAIKMKFLNEIATVYGFSTEEYEERLFLLHVFLLAFSSPEKKREVFDTLENWEERKQGLLELDWRVFQQEYRDYIDFVKMLQLVPGIGAFVGAYANYQLLDTLGETAMNCYRLRVLKAGARHQ